MISKSFKVLEVKDGQEYVFDSFAFKASVRKFLAEARSAGKQSTMEAVKNDLAEETFASVDSINNWLYGRNGVADLETVKTMAKYLGIDYLSLLRVQEDKKMIESKENNYVFSEVNMDKTKDVIRSVYQKMSECMDIAAECVRFDYSMEFFEDHEHYYKDAERALHLSMLDIPADIYDQLQSVLSDLEIYYYGVDRGYADIWDTSDYSEFLKEKDREDGDFSQMLFMEKEAAEFYKKMRDILKDYITA